MAGGGGACEEPPRSAPPNVVVLLADDAGYGDFSFVGNRNLSTPAIESLARDGAVLRQLMVQVRPVIDRAGTGQALADDRQYLGETYLPVFMDDVMNLLT